MKHFFRHAFFFMLYAVLSFGYTYAQIFSTATDEERCDITAVTAGLQACGPMVDYYTQEIIVTYENPPEGGQLWVEINGDSRFIPFEVTGSPQSIWLENLPADGLPVSIFTKFSNDNGCTWNARNLFTAPLDCSRPMAWVQLIHNAPDSGLSPVDIYLSEDFGIAPQSTFFDDMAFKTATRCLPVEPGMYQLGFARANSLTADDTLMAFPFTFAAGEKYILMMSGVSNPANFDQTNNPEDISFDVKSFTPGQFQATMEDEMDILSFQGVPDMRMFDIVADGMAPSFVNNIIYGTFQDYSPLSASPHKLDVMDMGNTTTYGSFYADLSHFGGKAGVMFLAGFVDSLNNQDNPGLGLCMALPDGHVIDFPPYVECEISSVEAGNYLGCNPDDVTYDQEIIVTYDTDSMEAGDLVIHYMGMDRSDTVVATGSPQTIVLADLPIDGSGGLVSIKVSFSNAAPPCYFRAADLFRAPRHCRCDITAVTTAEQSECDFSTETYSQEIVVEYINEPSTGYLQVEINGDSQFLNFPITGSPQTVLLEDLTGDGELVDIFVKFSDTDNCTWTARDLYRAPNCRPCEFTDIRAGLQLNCDEDSATYDQQIIIEYSEAPTTGYLLVSIDGGTPLSYAITGSPQTVVVEGLPVGGDYYDVSVNFSDKDCERSERDVFRSPDGCRCEITDIEAGDQTACDPRTNTYDQDIIVYYANPPADGYILVELNDDDNYLEFEITGSPQTIALEGLESDDEYVDVEVKFSRDSDCRRFEENVFRAPESCKPEIISYSLVDADADTIIDAYDPIPDGAVLNLYFLPTDNLNIRANTDPEEVGSVRFRLEGSFDFDRVEEEFPYALFGNIPPDYFDAPQPFEAGMSFELMGIPYTEARAMGIAGDANTISFSFIFNIPPTAEAGANDTINFPDDSVRICGYGMDPDGFIATYAWTQLSGPSTATLDTSLRVDTTIVNDTIITPDTLTTVDSTFTTDTLIVTDTLLDMNGLDSIVVDTVIVMDTIIINDTIVVMDTTVNTSMLLDTLVCLTATDLQPGTYYFQLCVTDNGGLTDCDKVGVTVVPPPPPPGPRVVSFTLIDADADVPVTGYDPIPDSASIDIAGLPTRNLSIRANAEDGDVDAVQSVRLILEGSVSNTRTENVAPYALFGDSGGNYTGRSDLAEAGNSFTITGTAYAGSNASGNTEGPFSIDFSFINSAGRATMTTASSLRRGLVEVFPNPSNGNFSIIASPALESVQLGRARLYISNSLGQVIYKGELEENVVKSIKLSNESEGLYIIRVEGNGYIATDKILIEK